MRYLGNRVPEEEIQRYGPSVAKEIDFCFRVASGRDCRRLVNAADDEATAEAGMKPYTETFTFGDNTRK